MKTISFSQNNYFQIIRHFQNDGVCIFPSDTSYGFSANPFSSQAIAQIQAIKGRSASKPFLLLVADMDMAQEYGVFSEELKTFARKRWEESDIPTTVLVEKKAILSAFFPDHATVGLRVPADSDVQKFLQQWGKPLISTSANRSGANPLFDPNDIQQEFSTENIWFIDKGPLPQKPPSQIWKAKNTKLVRVR